LAACDVVVTKPGYGIVADCLANRVAVLYTDRGPFREYDVLAQALPRLGRAGYIARAELLAGRLGPHLDALLESRASWTEQPFDGAQCVARRVLELR
jgi:UDP-N-acetylglucosamine:LPS N-acetylglucosamine transferase